MRSCRPGKNTFLAEVQGISRNGVWLYAKGREFLLGFADYPWFKDAKVSAVYNVKLLHRTHLCWPDLDVDLDIDSLEHSEKFPLKAMQVREAGKAYRAPRKRPSGRAGPPSRG